MVSTTEVFFFVTLLFPLKPAAGEGKMAPDQRQGKSHLWDVWKVTSVLCVVGRGRRGDRVEDHHGTSSLSGHVADRVYFIFSFLCSSWRRGWRVDTTPAVISENSRRGVGRVRAVYRMRSPTVREGRRYFKGFARRVAPAEVHGAFSPPICFVGMFVYDLHAVCLGGL